MLSTAESLAQFLGDLTRRGLRSPLSDKLALHLFDTLGALVSGLGIADTKAALGITAAHGNRSAPLPDAWVSAAAIRCTEIDDIHLSACVTPSAAIVPVLLDLASRDGGISGARLMGAYLGGLEMMIRFAGAAGGPRLMPKGLWPSRLAAPLGAAAAASAILSAAPERTAHALAIAAAMAAGLSPRGATPSSRWLIFGRAVGDGILAAEAAARGVTGELALLDGKWSETTGIALDPGLLSPQDGDEPSVLRLGLKPWCAARQTMAAVAAFQQLLRHRDLDATSLARVRVEVPQEYSAMIDRRSPPAARQETFSNLRYLLGLAAFAPDGLIDVRRDDLRIDARFEKLAAIIRVEGSDALSSLYPSRWPARVTIGTASGASDTIEIADLPGDAPTPLDWHGVEGKIAAATGLHPDRLEPLSRACRALPIAGDVREFVAAVVSLLAAVDEERAGIIG